MKKKVKYSTIAEEYGWHISAGRTASVYCHLGIVSVVFDPHVYVWTIDKPLSQKKASDELYKGTCNAVHGQSGRP